MLNLIKYLLSKFYSPKYVLKGSCKMCGRCCRNIVFFAYDKPITDEKTYYELREKNKRLNLFYPTGKNEKGEVLFTCKSLLPNNHCKYYFFRSLYCRKYPLVKSLTNGKYLTPPEGCGYSIELNKKFSDYMK